MLTVLGILVVFRGYRRVGAAIALVSFAWFVLATQVIIPWRNGVGAFYDQLFGNLGNSPTQVAWHLVTHPGKAWSIATAHDRLVYYRAMLFPVALVPLLSPQTFAIGVPMLAINVFTSDGFPFTRDARYHYSAIVLVGLLVATAEAIALMRDPRVRAVVVGVLLLSAFTATVWWGPSPIGRDYHNGTWPLQRDTRAAAKNHALALLPVGASTSAAYTFVPHLTHRTHIYEFPVPWRDINWGVHGEHLDDPRTVRWIVVDRLLLSARDTALLNRLLSGQFRVRYERDGIVLAQRVRT
jgi:uncharacterized membrane protein